MSLMSLLLVLLVFNNKVYVARMPCMHEYALYERSGANKYPSVTEHAISLTTRCTPGGSSRLFFCTGHTFTDAELRISAPGGSLYLVVSQMASRSCSVQG